MLITTGTSNEVVQRLLAEQSAQRYEVDLFMMDILKQNQVIDANGLRELEPLLVHPEVTDLSLWYNNQYLWADVDRKYVLGYAAIVNRDSIITAGYNTDMVSEEDIERIMVDQDFVAPWFVEKFKGNVLMMAPPPYSTAGGGNYYTIAKHPSLGREFLKEFMTVLDSAWETDNRRACDFVAQGKYAWAFFGSNVAQCLDELSESGLPTAEFEMEAGAGQEPFLSGGSSAMQISAPINPPHPNAAQLALNWLLSVEGQTANNELANVRDNRYPRPSLRNDVPPREDGPGPAPGAGSHLRALHRVQPERAHRGNRDIRVRTGNIRGDTGHQLIRSREGRVDGKRSSCTSDRYCRGPAPPTEHVLHGRAPGSAGLLPHLPDHPHTWPQLQHGRIHLGSENGNGAWPTGGWPGRSHGFSGPWAIP